MTVTFMKSGEKVRYAGSVIRHERPETARGVVFMTLEDEASFVNAAVWESVFSTTHFVKNGTVSLLGVTGNRQGEDNVVHLVAKNYENRR